MTTLRTCSEHQHTSPVPRSWAYDGFCDVSMIFRGFIWVEAYLHLTALEWLHGDETLFHWILARPPGCRSDLIGD